MGIKLLLVKKHQNNTLTAHAVGRGRSAPLMRLEGSTNMKTLPESLNPVRKTPEFDEGSIPKGLLKAHQTKAGVWGKIVIIEGKLQYKINEPEEEIIIIDSEKFGVIEPTILHEVKPLGSVKFYGEC